MTKIPFLKKHSITVFFSLLFLFALSLYIAHHTPNRTLQFGNCKIHYHHFLDGGGDPDGWTFPSGPGESYPNDFWYQQARINLFRCMLDEYTKTKDSTIARALNDSIFKDSNLANLYVSFTYKTGDLNEAGIRFMVDLQQNKTNIPPSLLDDSLRYIADQYNKEKNPIDVKKLIVYIFNNKKDAPFFKYLGEKAYLKVNMDTLKAEEDLILQRVYRE